MREVVDLQGSKFESTRRRDLCVSADLSRLVLGQNGYGSVSLVNLDVTSRKGSFKPFRFDSISMRRTVNKSIDQCITVILLPSVVCRQPSGTHSNLPYPERGRAHGVDRPPPSNLVAARRLCGSRWSGHSPPFVTLPREMLHSMFDKREGFFPDHLRRLSKREMILSGLVAHRLIASLVKIGTLSRF